MSSDRNALKTIISFLGGVFVGAAATMALATRKRRGPIARRRVAGPLVTARSNSSAVYDPLTRTYVTSRDVRKLLTDTPPSQQEIDSFLRRRRLSRPMIHTPPPPGGLGAGVTLQDSLLHFRDDTGVYFYLVAPAEIGSQAAADLLYMTSSNAAKLGCEALLSFFKDERFSCVFRVWDWSTPDQPGGGKFVKGLTYRDLTDYLIPYTFELANGETLDTVCVYVVNLTRRTSGDGFRNEVYLHNHAVGTRDLVHSNDFSWPNQGSDQNFWWGPIFETFPDPGAQYVLSNAVGFSQALVVQDKYEYQLTDADSELTLPSNDGLSPIYIAHNSALVCR